MSQASQGKLYFQSLSILQAIVLLRSVGQRIHQIAKTRLQLRVGSPAKGSPFWLHEGAANPLSGVILGGS